MLVVHTTRLDAEGRHAITRVDHALREQWTAKLPIQELANRFESPDHLLMYGATQLTQNGTTRWQEFVVALATRDRRTRAWNVTLESSGAPAELEQR
jgi:hypothetical protein